jgi:two-component system probable response regulator PhcQ
MGHTVLLVDDEPRVLEGLSRVLRKEPYEILTANGADEAALLMKDRHVDLVVSDEEMPGMSGTELLARIAGEYPDIMCIVLTGHPTLPAAVRAINDGKVYQFLTKPCNEIDLAITIRRALEQKDLLVKSRELLEITKHQSSLIEEARLCRRLRPSCGSEETKSSGQRGQPADQQELLSQMDGEISKGRELLGDTGPVYDPR